MGFLRDLIFELRRISAMLESIDARLNGIQARMEGDGVHVQLPENPPTKVESVLR